MGTRLRKATDFPRAAAGKKFYYIMLWGFAGGEGFPRHLQILLHQLAEWVRSSQTAPRGRFDLLKRRHGLAEIFERGTVIFVERPRVNTPHRERDVMTLSENASRHRNHFAHQ